MQQQDKHPHFGLALSGGGFRAALYHLGVVRFLRDAQLLSGISRITSVSGGSIIGAHMAMNWQRYCGTEEEFQQVSSELIKLVRMDVRNRIVRRFPFMAFTNFLRRILLLGTKRQLTRTGLLEQHYEQFLYGDTALLDLPDAPHLYILATDLSDGSLCAFCKEGLMLRRRNSAGKPMDVQTVEMGLATVPMAVAASSAFPGFFPPLEILGNDVGANEGEFPRHAFTDGGIYDNLGLRMFRFLHGLDLVALEEQTNTPINTEADHLNGVFVSDAGASFKVRTESRAGGLLRTALRATDILMDRVNEMELESFAGTPGAVFIPITKLVDLEQDPTAMHPEVQKQVALIRTDLDSFSDMEIAALIQHGYSVARQVVRETPHLENVTTPEGSPWDPFAPLEKDASYTQPLNDRNAVLSVARKLQKSSSRRFLSKFLSVRDWPSYIWVPLIALTVLAVPTSLYKMHQVAKQQEQVLSAIAQSSPLYGYVLDLLKAGKAERYEIPKIAFKDTQEKLEPLDFTGYDVVSDDRVYDLRGWAAEDGVKYPPQMHARFQILRTEAAEFRPTLRFQLPSDKEYMRVSFLPDSLKPVHVRQKLPNGHYLYQSSIDFGRVPIGTETTMIVHQELPSIMATQEFNSARFRFTIAADTGLARIWVLLPRERAHDAFELYRFPINHPNRLEIVHATTSVEVPTGAIVSFQLINPPEGYRYEARWRWVEDR